MKKISHNLIHLFSAIFHNGGFSHCKTFPVRHRFTYFYLAILNLIMHMERTKTEKFSPNLTEGQFFDIFTVPLKRDTIPRNLKQHQNLPSESNVRLTEVLLYFEVILTQILNARFPKISH